MMATPIYLDHNATTPLLASAQTAMSNHLSTFGNPSSHHSYGRLAREAIENAREQLARCVDCRPEQIIWTSSGSEANNTIIHHIITTAMHRQSTAHIIISAIEHPCMNESVTVAKTLGMTVTYVPVDSHGIVNPADIRSAIRADTVLISVMTANNEVGSIQDIRAIGDIAQEYDIPFHTDAAQAIGKMVFSFKQSNADFATISAHKFGGPKGAAALICKHLNQLTPLISGGPQEQEMRAGTENTLAIIGAGEAADAIHHHLEERMAHFKMLKHLFINEVKRHSINAKINTPENSIPNTISIAFPSVSAESLVMRLDLDGLCCSTGSACATGSTEASYVLKAMSLDSSIIHGTLRLSTGIQTSEEDIKHAVNIIKHAVQSMTS